MFIFNVKISKLTSILLLNSQNRCYNNIQVIIIIIIIFNVHF